MGGGFRPEEEGRTSQFGLRRIGFLVLEIAAVMLVLDLVAQ